MRITGGRRADLPAQEVIRIHRAAVVAPMRRAPSLPIATVIALVAPAAAAPIAAAGTRTIVIRDIDFHPRSLTIHRGTTARWRFADGTTPHNVTSRGHLRFRSSPTKQSGTYRVRFTRRGTYRYVCTIHPNMRARVVVR